MGLDVFCALSSTLCYTLERTVVVVVVVIISNRTFLNTIFIGQMKIVVIYAFLCITLITVRKEKIELL